MLPQGALWDSAEKIRSAVSAAHPNLPVSDVAGNGASHEGHDGRTNGGGAPVRESWRIGPRCTFSDAEAPSHGCPVEPRTGNRGGRDGHDAFSDHPGDALAACEDRRSALNCRPRGPLVSRDRRRGRVPVAADPASSEGLQAGIGPYTWTNSSGSVAQIGQEAGGWFGSMWPHAGHRKSCVSSASFSCVTVASATAQSRARSASS